VAFTYNCSYRSAIAALVLVVALTSVAHGAAVASAAHAASIDGPKTVQPGHPAWFQITDLATEATAAWFPSPCLQAGPPHITEGSALFWTVTPGTYEVNAIAAWLVDGKIRLLPLTATVEVAGDAPDPPVPPDPPPPPNQKWQVVIVFESADLDNYPRSQQVMLGSLTFRSSLKTKGHKLVAGGIIDKDIKDRDGKTPEALKPFLGAASGKPLPQLCIAPVGGGEVRAVPLPLTEAEVFQVLEGKTR